MLAVIADAQFVASVTNPSESLLARIGNFLVTEISDSRRARKTKRWHNRHRRHRYSDYSFLL